MSKGQPGGVQSPPDIALLKRIAEKEVEALSILYDRYSARFFGLALKILDDRALAEEVVQDLFLFIWQESRRFDNARGSCIAWLMVLCRNRCIDKLRSAKANLKRTAILRENMDNFLTNESQDPLQFVSHKETQETVAQALAQIPEEQRTPIQLTYFEGLSQTEIAEYLKVPLGTIKTRIRLGMQKLRNLINKTT